MLQKTRELLVLALIAVLPFHALLVTAGTRLLAGAGQAPLPELALWKEILLAGVLVIVILEICYSLLVTRYSLRVDTLDWLIFGLFVLSVLVPILNFPFGLELMAERLLTTPFFFGFKYTLFPLLLFLILRRVPWSGPFFHLTSSILLLVGTVVSVYGILTLFLPQAFFTWLGYSDLHSTYLPDGPLAAFQYLEGTGIRRMQATFAGPNQLGMWLLVPWSIAVSALVRKAPHPSTDSGQAPSPLPPFGLELMAERRGEGKSFLGFLALLGVVLFFTFSRAAWVGAVVILLAALMRQVSPRARRRLLVAGCSFLTILLLVTAVLRPRSTKEHLRRPLQALQVIARHPFGLGLGTAGPAANRTGDSCVYLEEGADSSWAKDRPNLCVFVGDQQVQPVGRACRCPFLPENWYLQVGVELGVLGLVLYLALVALVARWLVKPDCVSCLAFLGISVAALFLHAWEDSAVAYTVWILVAAVLPSFNHRLSSPSTIVC